MIIMIIMIIGVAAASSGCGKTPETAPEDRIVRVSLDPADREAIMASRFEGIRAGMLEIRAMEASRPDPEVDREAYAVHADALDERTRELISVMADERWTPDERRLMQRVLRFATAEDLGGQPDAAAASSGSDG